MTTLFIFLSIIWIVNSQELLSNPKCNQKMDPGTCNNFAISYYYDRYAHRCREFFYSGCGGTENRFSTLQECSSQCHFVSSEETALQRCSQNHDPGTCQSDIERWYFDWNMKRCVCSWWSGCGGNSNRYYSYNHCMEICREFSQGGPVFIQPAYIAPRPEPQPGVSNYDTIAYSDYPSNDYSNFPNYNQHHPQNNIGNDNNQFVGQSQHVLAPLINTNLQHSANHQSSIQPSSVLFPSQNTNHLHSPPELDSEAVLRGNFQFPNLVNQASPLVIERPNPLKKIYGEPDLFGDFQFDPEYEISTNGEYKAMTSAKEERIFFDQKTKKPLLNLRGTRSSLDEVIRHEQEPVKL